MIENKLQYYTSIIHKLAPTQDYFVFNERLIFVAASNGFMYSLEDADLISKPTDLLVGHALNFYNSYKQIAKRIMKSKEIEFNYINIHKTPEHVLLGRIRISKILDDNGNLLGFINLIDRIKYCPSIIGLVAHSPGADFIEISNTHGYDDNSPINTLTEQEQMICWLLNLNKSFKEIAYILEQVDKKPVSISTISSSVYRNICNKFNIEEQADLIDYLQKHDVLTAIPERLFRYLSRTSG